MFFGGLAGIWVAALFGSSGNRDDGGHHPNPIALLGALGGISSLIISPFVYFPGVARENNYRMWKQGRFTNESQKDGVGESEQNRNLKRFGLHANLFGSEGGDGSSVGLIFSRFQNHNELIELNLAGSQNIDFPHSSVESRLVFRFCTLRYTRFFGNSFYLASGFGYRDFHGQVSKLSQRIDIEGSDEWDSRIQFYDLKQKDLGFEIAVGNRWQWQSYSMGFDWLGTYLPVIKIAHSRRRDADPENVDKDESGKAIENLDYLQHNSFQGFRFHLGSTF